MPGGARGVNASAPVALTLLCADAPLTNTLRFHESVFARAVLNYETAMNAARAA
jgi:hypothetical protein